MFHVKHRVLTPRAPTVEYMIVHYYIADETYRPVSAEKETPDAHRPRVCPQRVGRSRQSVSSAKFLPQNIAWMFHVKQRGPPRRSKGGGHLPDVRTQGMPQFHAIGPGYEKKPYSYLRWFRQARTVPSGTTYRFTRSPKFPPTWRRSSAQESHPGKAGVQRSSRPLAPLLFTTAPTAVERDRPQTPAPRRCVTEASPSPEHARSLPRSRLGRDNPSTRSRPCSDTGQSDSAPHLPLSKIQEPRARGHAWLPVPAPTRSN